METKKTYKADLENKRPLWFLLGLVFVLAVFYAALDYSSGGYSDDLADSDDLLENLDLLASLKRHEVTVAPIPPASPAPSKALRPSENSAVVQLEDIVAKANTGKTDGQGDEAGLSNEETAPLPAKEEAKEKTVTPTDRQPELRIVRQIPEYPGGMSALVKWLTDNLRYPAKARQQKIEGRVVVSFIIGTDGSISDMKVATSAGPLLDGEALRLLQRMPKWKPGIEDGKPCRTLFAIPIVFKLQ